jgi:hypothetical protein
MIDIIELQDGEDMIMRDSVVAKAGNVLSIQIGSLEYSSEFGVDLNYFMQSDFQFQNESFQAYCVTRLTESQVNVSDVITSVEALLEKYTYFVGEQNQAIGGLNI